MNDFVFIFWVLIALPSLASEQIDTITNKLENLKKEDLKHHKKELTFDLALWSSIGICSTEFLIGLGIGYIFEFFNWNLNGVLPIIILLSLFIKFFFIVYVNYTCLFMWTRLCLIAIFVSAINSFIILIDDFLINQAFYISENIITVFLRSCSLNIIINVIIGYILIYIDKIDKQKQCEPEITAKLKNSSSWYEYESVTVNRRGEIIKRTPGQAKYYREDLGNGVYLDMVYIPGGSFLMGAPASEHRSLNTERPQHRVTVPEIWMGKYQVTQKQWEAIMGNNPAEFKGANRPVEQVTWDDCQDFCRRLSERTGKWYRLPSEPEWEYACRAGTKTPFSCGETITTDLANYNGNETYADEERGKYREGTIIVGSFPPNPWGLYDMHGNVREWCEDTWHDNYKKAPADGSSWTDNHQITSRRVIRGGSWFYHPTKCRSANREDISVNDSHVCSDFGLRLVLVMQGMILVS